MDITDLPESTQVAIARLKGEGHIHSAGVGWSGSGLTVTYRNGYDVTIHRRADGGWWCNSGAVRPVEGSIEFPDPFAGVVGSEDLTERIERVATWPPHNLAHLLPTTFFWSNRY